MDVPTAADIRAWAPPSLNWEDYGIGEPWGDGEDPLAVRVQWAVGQLFADTGRTLESIKRPEEVAIAQQVLVAFTVLGVLGGSEQALQVQGAPWLKSFSAGSYSETRFSPAELSARGAPPYPQPLWNLLWALMTDEKKDDWRLRLGLGFAPAAGFVSVDWSGDGERGPAVWGPGVDTYYFT